jgi:glycosyltransferase involved in cell wall biosynthesis
MKIIPIGVNDIFYQDYSKKDVDKVLDKYNLEKNNYFIQIGHITKKKNHIFTLKLIKDKLQKNKKLKIVFIGRKDDKKACKKLTTFINKHNLSNQVIFTGGIDQNKESKTIPVLLQNALIAFFPSTYEGFGIPAVEAMAAATPILVSNRGSLSEVIGEEHTIPLEDTRKWQEQLDLLISDKKQYNIKTEKQKKIANKYRWDNISKEYIKTFNNLL